MASRIVPLEAELFRSKAEGESRGRSRKEEGEGRKETSGAEVERERLTNFIFFNIDRNGTESITSGAFGLFG